MKMWRVANYRISVFEYVLRHSERSDIDVKDLFNEIQTVAAFMKERKMEHVIDDLNELRHMEMEKFVSNAAIAYRIFLTLPVSIASSERY